MRLVRLTRVPKSVKLKKVKVTILVPKKRYTVVPVSVGSIVKSKVKKAKQYMGRLAGRRW
jgi:hypothetical protein